VKTYVSAITEPRSLSLVGSAESIARLFEYASQNGLPADKMDVTGKGHNPENAPRLPAFLKFLDTSRLFRLPEKSKLQVPVRSNRTGEQVWDDTFMEDMVIMMMASCCDWYKLLTRVAEALKATNRPSHHLVIFGLGDSAPLLPFNKQRLKISKFQAHTLILEKGSSSPIAIPEILTSTNAPKLPAHAIAVVGVSCRLPGANNLDELWDLLSNGRDTHQEVPKDRFDINTSSRVSQDNALKDRKFFGNFIDDVKRFDNIFFGINAKEAASMDPQQRMLLECSFEALDSSGYLASHIRETGDSVGCFIGNSVNDYLDNINSHPPSAYTATGTIRAFLSGRLSHYYGWIAPSEVVDTACSSSLVAINRACYAIQTGQCKMALAGGVGS
jgi:acyl transferase domain-containing protein